MSTRVKKVSAALAVLAVPLLATGCGAGPGRPPLGKVHGVVTYKGKPVTNGSVIFTPAKGQKGEGQIATGQIGSDGSYSLTTFDTGDGAVLGQHVVTIEARPAGDELREMNTMKGGAIAYKLPKSTAPSKYSNVATSPLRHTVDAGSNTINLEMKD